MEFWLSQGMEKLQLPVPPQEYSVDRSANNETFEVEGFGEISFIGKTSLATASIESFFPNKAYSFCQYSNFPSPKECVALIEKWMHSGEPIRYMVTGTSINMECTIEKFEYSEKDGTRDIFFTLELKEYRRIALETKTVTATTNKTVTTSKRVTPKPAVKTYTVKAGDTLSKIAKKVYGDSSKWKYIQNKNKDKIKNPNMIYVGQVLVI